MDFITLSPLLAAGILTLALGILVIYRSQRAIKVPFAVACLLLSIMDMLTFLFLLEQSAGVEIDTSVFLIFVPFLPAAFFLITLYIVFEDTYEGSLSNSWIWAVLIFPIISILVILSNPLHGLFRYVSDGVSYYGPWWTVIVIYMILTSTLPLFFLAYSYHKVDGHEKRLMLYLIAAYLILISINPMMIMLGSNPITFVIAAIISMVVLYLIFWLEFGFETIMASPRALRTILECIGDDMILLDAHERVVIYSEPAIGILGIGDTDILGKSLLSAIPGSLRGISEDLVMNGGECMISGQSEQNDDTYLLKSFMIHTPGGTRMGSFLMFIDQTEVVERRSLEIANEKLDMMTSMIRHDMNNHLMALDFYLDEIAKSSEGELRALSERGLGIIHSMGSELDFTKTYQNIGVQSPVWLRLHDEVDTAISDVNGDVRISNGCDSTFEIKADMMFGMVISNLIDNSFRHGGDVSSIHITSIREDDVVDVIYEDDGMGIPAGSKESIFEMGYGSNTGLGLYMARNILSITGIDIVEDGSDGARFVITVPHGMWRQVS